MKCLECANLSESSIYCLKGKEICFYGCDFYKEKEKGKNTKEKLVEKLFYAHLEEVTNEINSYQDLS